MAKEVNEGTVKGGSDLGCFSGSVDDKKLAGTSPLGCLKISKSDSLAHFKFLLNNFIFLFGSTLKYASRREKVELDGGVVDPGLWMGRFWFISPLESHLFSCVNEFCRS